VFVFDDPGEPMDRAAQAARCALRLRHARAEAPVAVAVGWVSAAQRGSSGEVLDRAAKMIAAAPPAAADRRPVPIGGGTASLLGARFDVREHGGRFTLHGELEVVPPRRPLLGRQTPFVGRGGELRQLEGLYETCVEDGTPRAAVVIAPAGAGKS